MVRFASSVGAVALAALCIPSPTFAQPVSSGVPVSTAKSGHQDVPIFDRGIGTVQAFQSVLVRARVDGTIERIAFSEGQEVKPGDLLAEIDPRPYQATYDQALAKKAADLAMLSNAKRDLARYSDLARSDFASRQSVDTQSASVLQTTANTQADDAAIAAAKLNLDFTRITSPIAGRVGLRLVDTGNLVHASDASGIVTVNQIHPISVLFTLPQDAFPTVQDAIDSSTGTIRLKAEFANTDDRLWPGQFVNIHLQLRVARDAVTVPSPAVQRGVNGFYVYVVKPGNVVGVQLVDIGQDNGQVAIVTKGLSGGETVVTGGQSRLTDGTKIASTAPNAPNDTAPAKAGG